MYADREEEVLNKKKASIGNGRPRHSNRRERSPPLSASSSRSRSVSRSISPVNRRTSRSKRQRDRDDYSPSHSTSTYDKNNGKELNAEDRERELQEKLRKRAMMSKRRKQSDSPSQPPRSMSPEQSDRRRAEQRRERRRGADLLDRIEDVDDDRRSRGSRRRPAISRSRSRGRSRSRSSSHSRSVSRSRSRTRSPARSGSRRMGSGSKRGSSRRLSPEVDEYDRRRRGRGRERSEERYDDPYAYRRDEPRRFDPYYDPYYDRRAYYPPGPAPPRGYPDRYGGGPPRHDRYYDPPAPPRSRHTRSPSPPSSARRRRGESKAKSPDPDDYELRSVFCSQLAARLGQRDLGEFFEDKLGEGTVRDVRIITDRNTGRSKGIGYVELKDEALVTQALALSSTPLFGIPIMIQRTEAARNRIQTVAGIPNLPALTPEQLAALPKINGEPIHIDPANLAGGNANSRLYVGSLHFSLTEEDIKAVFEPFGAILSVDLHREPGTLKSKGFCFVQFVSGSSAEKALQHMNGFELAGRQIKVGHVASRSGGATSSTGASSFANSGADPSGAGATVTSSFDEGGGGGLNANSRAALMEKLARVDHTSTLSVPSEQQRPSTIPQAMSKAVLLKNMFNPEEETEKGWDKELAEDVKEECEDKYGKVTTIKVDVESGGEIWLKFEEVEGAKKAINGLNGRFFGGRSITAAFVSEGIFNSMLS